MIFCFKHFNSSRCFDSFLGKFNAINGNLGKFLKREKKALSQIFDWVLNTPMQNHLYLEVFIAGIPKDNFSKKFFKIARKVSLMDYFSKKSSYMDATL